MVELVANVHGTGLVIGGHGILLRGPSGAGKSLLCLDLLRLYRSGRMAARLVADDRVELFVDQESLFMRAPEAIRGKIELRGRGIVERPVQEVAQLHLIADIEDDAPRLPEHGAFRVELYGVSLARCVLPSRSKGDFGHQVLLIEEALDGLLRWGDRGEESA